jgi:hypothetical protein
MKLDKTAKFKYESGSAVADAIEKGKEHIRINLPGTPVTDSNVIRFLIMRGAEWIEDKKEIPY